jgi:excisionase family DNA binding protein
MAADATTPAGRAHIPSAAGASVGHPVMHTAEEAARLLKVKRSWLERQAAARKIPFSMLGGSYRFTDRHLAEIVRMNEVAPQPTARKPPRSARAAHNAPLDAEPMGTVAPLRPRPRHGPRRG